MIFYVIVVVYNQLISNTLILKTNKNQNTHFIFADNSTKEEILQLNKNFCNNNDILYLSMNGNKGLPKAYNEAIKNVPKEMHNWIVICDQDTELEVNFLDTYQKAINNNPQKLIFCPVIKDSKGIMSPSKIKGKKIVHSKLKNYNEQIQNYSFINSCMCINSTVFNSVQYDENLFLDCVDHDFVKMVHEKFNNEIFYVIYDIEIFQNFSGVTKNSFSADFNRFRIYKKDLQYFNTKWYGKKSIANKILFSRAIKLSIQHKKFDFIKVFFT